MNENNIIKINRTNRLSVAKSFDIFNPELNTEDDTIIKGIYNNIFYDEDLEEHSYFQMFYGINQYLPQSYFDEVYMDNINFYNDQKIFHKDFNEFLNGILENIVNLISIKDVDPSFMFKAYEISIKFLLEIYSRSYYKEVYSLFIQHLSKIIKNLSKILEIIPEYSFFIIDQLLQNKQKLNEFLFCSDEQSSSSFKEFILMSINIIFRIKSEEIKSEIIENKSTSIFENQPNLYTLPVLQLLDYFISFFPKELSKNWTKFSSYLEVISYLSS